jgi:hypothetical protein
MENITSDSWSNEYDLENKIDCNDLTNNWLYLIFTGYLLPLLSPKLRGFGKEALSVFRNMGRIDPNTVSMTEFGFDKIQELTDNKGMTEFIQRISDKHNFNVLPDQINEIAWSFSGDTNHGKNEHRQETWKKLLNELDRQSILNKMERSNRKNKP